MKHQSAPLFGLLLVGGKSSRMGEDKASLIYRDQTPEWSRLRSHLSQVCEASYLCHREDQDFGVEAIIDPGNGPLAAIHCAQQAHPEAAWLVIACDLPLLELETLQDLVSARDNSVNAVCFASAIDGLPEPLCAIYEPTIAPTIHEAIHHNKYCPRKLLTDAKLISLNQSHALMNANTKADTVEINSILNDTQTEKSVTLQYFGQLKDLAGVEEEKVTTKYATASGLFEQLKTLYKFPHKQKQLMLAINDEFSPWETPLKEGDTIVFIPPVAGG